ncbi:MAG: baseplate J/gp47 family protein [Vitreoscilla sp.]|nr:baseplate J/gp47 family protein [Vitreoscilla sp.]
MGLAAMLQHQVERLGQSQGERDDPRLDPAHAPLQGLDEAELLVQLRALAGELAYFGSTPGHPSGNWASFLPDGDLASLRRELARADGQVPPHQALLYAVLALSRTPQALLDGLVARQLDFQWRQMLGFVLRPAQADHVHVVATLKKGTAPLRLTPTQLLSAGPDARGVPQHYRPVRDTPIGRGQVAELRALRRDGGRLRFAPVAPSADGLGAPLPAGSARFSPFGPADSPEAPVGLALASPLLRLADGQREIRVSLRLGGAMPAAAALAATLEAWLTGPKGWLGPFPVSGSASGDRLVLATRLGAAEPAVTDHAAAIHRQPYPDGTPVWQLLLRSGASLPGGAAAYGVLAQLGLQRAQLSVQVTAARPQQLGNDHGNLNPKKSFQPFGAQPVIGSRLVIGHTEALAKPLVSLRLRLDWQGAPDNLAAWYANYSGRHQIQGGVGARLRFTDGAGQAVDQAVNLHPLTRATTTLQAALPGSSAAPSPGDRLQALAVSSSVRGRWRAEQMALARPVLHLGRGGGGGGGGGEAAPAGSIELTLEQDFLHTAFRQEAVMQLMKPAVSGIKPPPLNEPYTPQLSALWLDYEARSDDAALDLADEASFSGSALQVFQVDAFGPARAHAWLSPSGQAPTLLPAHEAAGELWLGLSGLSAGDAVSLLFQVAEGSADPQATPQALRWSVLADTTWRPLAGDHLTLDTTRDLRASGLVQVTLPADTSTQHTRAPAGLVWLRAEIPSQPRAACDLVAVLANAAELRFEDQGNDPAHGALPLPAGTIAKLLTPVDGIKSIAQPFASWGGAVSETPAQLNRRAAERLRHRGRALTTWDVERLVLAAFPAVHRAKCIPHAGPGGWFQPGHRRVVVVPDLRGRPGVDPLQPRVDLDTLERIAAMLRTRSDAAVQTHVGNPRYLVVQVAFGVRLRRGAVFSLVRPTIERALQAALAPWTQDPSQEMRFGNRVYRSHLLQVVETLAEVDWVSDFRMRVDGGPNTAEALADTPDAIFVSAAQHEIVELVGGGDG